MGKVYLVPAGMDRPVPGLGGAEQGPDADDPALTLEVWRERIRTPSGRAQEPAPEPGVRRRHRQRLQRRDPPRRAPAAVPQAVVAGGRGSRRAVRRDAFHAGRRDRRPARTRPADVREAGPRLPGGARQGRPAVSTLRHPDHRGPRGRLHHVLLPRLPALTNVGAGGGASVRCPAPPVARRTLRCARDRPSRGAFGCIHRAAPAPAVARPPSGDLQDLTDFEGRRVGDPVELGDGLRRRAELRGDRRSACRPP